MHARLTFVLAMAILPGCSVMQQPSATAPPARTNWRVIATDSDRARLRDWREAFVDALAAGRRAGHGAEIEREGALLQPDAALPGAIPNGLYRCRVIKLGAKSEGMLDYIS